MSKYQYWGNSELIAELEKRDKENITCKKCGNPKEMFFCNECESSSESITCELCGKDSAKLDTNYHNNCNA